MCLPVIVLFLFLIVPWADLWSVIAAWPGQSHLFFASSRLGERENERQGEGAFILITKQKHTISLECGLPELQITTTRIL